MSVFKPSYRDKAGRQKRVSKWWIETRDHQGIVRRVPGYTDKRQTEKLAEKIEKLVVCRQNNEPPDKELAAWLETVGEKLRARFAEFDLIDPRRAAAGKPLTEHLNDFAQSLKDDGDTRKQVQQTCFRIRRMFKEAGFRTWSDISAAKVKRCLAKLREQGGIGKQTSNYYLKALKHFCSWMVKERRASESPVAHLDCLKVGQSDRRRRRRPLEPDEIRRLLASTAASGERFGLTGYQRSLVYRLAVETGLRASEIRSLKVSSFDFKNNTVRVESKYCKNRKEAELPLRPDTALEMQALLANKSPRARALGIPDKPAKMLKADLAEAAIPYVDESGRYVDFHSLRHTTGSLLAASGVHPKVAQSILRHSDINLTMGIYTHTLTGQESQAVESLPDFSLGPNSERQRATGTDGPNVTGDKNLGSYLGFGGTNRCNSMQRNAMPPHFTGSKTPFERARQDSNLQPSDSKSATLSN